MIVPGHQRPEVKTGSMRAVPDHLKERRDRRVTAVDHAVDALMVLSHAQSDLTLTELSIAIDMSKSATFELLRTLEIRRLVEHDTESQTYRLSWTMYELGASVLHRVALPSAAAYYLDRLAVETGQVALLSILKDRSVLYLVRGEAPPGLVAFANVGRRFPLHATASGKIFLAFHHDSEFMESILRSPLKRITPATIIDATRLRSEVGEVRRSGYATCWQEGEPELCSVAMPVRDHGGQTVAALALVGSSASLTRSSVRRFLPPLRSSVLAIETRLGLVTTAPPAASAPPWHANLANRRPAPLPHPSHRS